ncbi:MAG TPA: type II toxin-antitoxin system PemK/MazF family toxin [Anaerolineae bacterium]
MPTPGDVVTVDFPGATGVKRRPAVIISTSEYHTHRPDVIVGVLTAQIADATTPFDCLLRDWPDANLRRPTAFRSFLATMPAAATNLIGRCSERDWLAIRACLSRAISSR